jgi:mannosyl-oligosaccharide alpha-1,2-mannosidase
MAGVKEAFNHAWTGYRQHAFPHDELHPVSGGYGDSR